MPGTVLRFSELEFPPQIPTLACILPSTGDSLPTLAFRPTLVHLDSYPNSSFWPTGTHGLLASLPSAVQARSALSVPRVSRGLLQWWLSSVLRWFWLCPSHVTGSLRPPNSPVMCRHRHILQSGTLKPRKIKSHAHGDRAHPTHAVASTLLPPAAPGPHPLPGHLP